MEEMKVVNQNLLDTIGNMDWMIDNTVKLKELLPDPIAMSTIVELALKARLGDIGVLPATHEEFIKVIRLLIAIGLFVFSDEAVISTNKDFVFNIENAMLAW
jgi:hypothetical protein